jgi:hypothetical protein
MALRHRFSAFAAALLAASAVFVALPTSAGAGGPVPAGWAGADISWPQCGQTYPYGPNYVVLGVTGGHPFSGNPCLNSEYAWAPKGGMFAVQLYINLDYGLRQDGPLRCGATDSGCQAYNYGYDSAAWARQYASAQTGGASESISNWWLDVETGNSWSDDTQENSYVIQGALDYLQRSAGRTVGVYSTSYQWGLIAGSFAPPNTPNWVAGAYGLDDLAKCSESLWPGGTVWMIQYLNFDYDLDQNLGC